MLNSRYLHLNDIYYIHNYKNFEMNYDAILDIRNWYVD